MSERLDSWNLEDPQEAREFLVYVVNMGGFDPEPRAAEKVRSWPDARVVEIAKNIARKAGLRCLTVH